MLRFDDLHCPLDTALTPGTIYLVYGSDQQVKLELMRRGIPYSLLYRPSYEEMEQAFADGGDGFLSDGIDALIVFPASFKTINDKPLRPEDRQAVPNYQMLQVSSQRIIFIVGDPEATTTDLKSFYKKLEGGQFVSLIMPEGYGIEGTPPEWNRFPLGWVRQSQWSGEPSDEDLGNRLIGMLGTGEGIQTWRGITRNVYYRLFQEREGKAASIIRLLQYSPDYKCRDLTPWLSPFLNRLNHETWTHPGNLLGRFALWVYRATHKWQRPYRDGLKRISLSGRRQLIFSPSAEAARQFPDYLSD